MSITYEQIAKWIEPIAESSDWVDGSNSGRMLSFGRFTLWFTEGEGWDGNGFTPFVLAEVLAMRVSRLLNADGVHVKLAWSAIAFTVPEDMHAHHHVVRFEDHALRALAEFKANRDKNHRATKAKP